VSTAGRVAGLSPAQQFFCEHFSFFLSVKFINFKELIFFRCMGSLKKVTKNLLILSNQQAAFFASNSNDTETEKR